MRGGDPADPALCAGAPRGTAGAERVTVSPAPLPCVGEASCGEEGAPHSQSESALPAGPPLPPISHEKSLSTFTEPLCALPRGKARRDFSNAQLTAPRPAVCRDLEQRTPRAPSPLARPRSRPQSGCPLSPARPSVCRCGLPTPRHTRTLNSAPFWPTLPALRDQLVGKAGHCGASAVPSSVSAWGTQQAQGPTMGRNAEPWATVCTWNPKPM